VTRRLTLRELDYRLLHEVLDDVEWLTPTECQHALNLAGLYWYRVALVLERLVVDGYAEIKRPGSKVRRFRRRSS
jgi:hypothetical protein